MADLIPIKVTVAGTVRRLSLAASPPPTFGALLAAAAAPHGLAPADVATVTYTDAEGDEVTLSSDAELTEALRGGGMLRLRLAALPPPAPSAPLSPTPTDGEEGEGGKGGAPAVGEAFGAGVPPAPRLYPLVDRSETTERGGGGKDAPAFVDHGWGAEAAAAAAAAGGDVPLAPLSPFHPDADPPDSLDGEVADGATLVVARPAAAATTTRAVSFPEWTPPPPPPVEEAPAVAGTDALVVAGAPGGAAAPPSRLSEVLGEGLKAVIDVGVEPIVKAAKLAWADGEGLRLLGAPEDVDGGGGTTDGRVLVNDGGRDVGVHDRGGDSVSRRPSLPPAGVAALATSLHGALTDDGVAWAPATAIAAALHALLSVTWVGRAVQWVHAKHTEKERKAARRRLRRQQGAWWQAPPSAKASPSAAGWSGGAWGPGGGCGHRGCGGLSASSRRGAC